jgi:hypothetical protein
MQIIIFTPDKNQITLDVNDTTTIGDILQMTNYDSKNVVVFTGKPDNINPTPMIDPNWTLSNYNMFYENIAISIYNKEDTENYNYERYKMYRECTFTVAPNTKVTPEGDS